MDKDKKDPSLGHGVKIGIGIVLGIILFGLLFFGGCVYLVGTSLTNFENNVDNPVIEPSNIPTQPKNEIKPEVKNYNIGDSIIAGSFKWEIVKTSRTEIIGEYFMDTLLGKEASGEFLIIDVEVENVGNSAKYLSDSFLTLVDKDGRKFSPDTSASFYLKPQGSALVFEIINPGVTKKGKIVYDVPKSLEFANLIISNDLLSSSLSQVNLMWDNSFD